ncbi:L-serine ammonia-lyase, iron-sulfur-dependent subunit beta [Lacticaseibacillus brantae]|uniref:L-serine deaminase n=1 Tax=Lacticaseibacillus brantae DSM 23927 TaxID=1423727 RepID=A0A0R2AYX3_9LACO|nr:L-serine ammonia-lyase, iron-sulfur-dependent subunit beta [Lacticaseibacillus brantae]KRM72010.1 L-serine dehydratase, beta subunit [Lacticaseibacillus brantae DSM 23927]
MANNYKSVFEIIGPIMIGPSSSHTAGAVAIGQAAHDLFADQPTEIRVDYYESFAETHLGHGTDYAIVSGVLGFAPDDPRVPDAVEIAQKQGMTIHFVENQGPSPVNHPNTAVVRVSNAKKTIEVTGVSIGGGTIEIRALKFNGYLVKPQGPLPIVLAIPKPNQTAASIVTQLEAMTTINHQETYTNSEALPLFEFDLDRRLQRRQLEQLRAATAQLIYI